VKMWKPRTAWRGHGAYPRDRGSARLLGTTRELLHQCTENLGLDKGRTGEMEVFGR
jgi:hypothetical protein